MHYSEHIVVRRPASLVVLVPVVMAGCGRRAMMNINPRNELRWWSPGHSTSDVKRSARRAGRTRGREHEGGGKAAQGGWAVGLCAFGSCLRGLADLSWPLTASSSACPVRSTGAVYWSWKSQFRKRYHWDQFTFFGYVATLQCYVQDNP